LYHLAMAQSDPMLNLPNRYVVEMPDSLRERVGVNLVGVTKRAWLERNAFCYNVCLPAGFRGDLGVWLLSDLNRFFGAYEGIEAVVEPRRVSCLVLRRLGGKRVDGRMAGAPEYASDTTQTVVSGLPVSQLVITLAYSSGGQYRQPGATRPGAPR
jgi:hypothetical protein